MKTLKECINDAVAGGYALGHFNISNIEGLWAVFNSARRVNVPVIIGTSQGERDFMGAKQAVLLVKSLREEYDYPIFINADHTYSLEHAKEAIDIGYDSVIIDGAKLPKIENVELVKECVEYARSKNPEILIEGELGYIGQSSEVLNTVPEGLELTSALDAENFVKETGVDLFAPAVGNIHGMMKGGSDPRLDISRIKEISEAVKIPLVLHGGSGNDADFSDAINAGIRIIHVNTELRKTYMQNLKISLQENPDEVAPYKIMKPVVSAMEKLVESKLRSWANIK